MLKTYLSLEIPSKMIRESVEVTPPQVSQSNIADVSVGNAVQSPTMTGGWGRTDKTTDQVSVQESFPSF